MIQHARIAAAMWPGPDRLDGGTWSRARAALLSEMARDSIFAPHYKLVALRAFDRVRAAILAGAPLVPGAVSTHLRDETGRPPGWSERPDLAQGPVERTLMLLFGAAAAAAAEPHLDRERVFSALPARPDEAELVAPDHWCAGRYRMAMDAALDDPRWSHVVEMDVARAGWTLDRRQLLRDLAGMGLPRVWLTVGERLDRMLTASGMPTGIPGNIGSGQIVTLALRPLDEACRAAGAMSLRLVDGLIAPVENPAAGTRVEAGLKAAMAGLGLAFNPDKSGMSPRAALRDRRRDEVAVEPATLVEAPDPVAAARGAIADLSAFGTMRFKVENWALLTLGRARDPAGLERAISRFAEAPQSARIYALYAGLFLDDRAVGRRYAGMLASALDQLHPWQQMWGLSALWTAPAIDPALAAALPRIAGDTRAPAPLRATAAIVWSRLASERGWRALEDIATGTPSSHLRAAVAFGCRYRPAAVRRSTLAAWAPLDPNVALVATALERDLAGL